MRDRLLRKMLRERFVVTMLDGEAFTGLLDGQDESTVTLIDASIIGTHNVKVSGALHLPRQRIAYMQRPST